jgi:type VI secretion system protein ImpK
MQLVNCLIPLFAQLRAFVQQPTGDAATLTAQLDDAIAAARRSARDAGYSEADTEEALFAFAAWADELLLAPRWDGAAQWQRHLLQRRYFNLSNAGVAFYERLEKLTHDQLAVREVYYLCLGMGFGGRYAYDRNQKALTDIKRSNLALLMESGEGLPAATGQLLFPDGYGGLPGESVVDARPTLRARLRRRFSWSTVAVFVLPLVLLALLFGVYHAVVEQSVDAILTQINV